MIREARNFYYNVPSDPRLLLFDFYALSSFYNSDILSYVDESIQYSYNDAIEKITSTLKEHLLDVVYVSIVSELSYMSLYGDNKQRLYKILNKQQVEIIANIVVGGHLTDFATLDLAGELGVDNKTMVNIMHNLFRNLKWSQGYGGDAWASICIAWHSLYTANSIGSKIVAIDHMYDLEHNGGSILTKINSYNKGDANWVRAALDLKANATSRWELYSYCSSSVKPLLAYLIKYDDGTSLEMTNKQQALKHLGVKSCKCNVKDLPQWFVQGLETNYINITEAVIGLDKNGQLHWMSGEWNKGSWSKGTWSGGVWNYGEWFNGVWEGGKWVNGVWNRGIWHNGTWLDGTWLNGTWLNGIWEGGLWLNGEWHEGVWYNGIWRNGEWFKGNWINGTWEGGVNHTELQLYDK